MFECSNVSVKMFRLFHRYFNQIAYQRIIYSLFVYYYYLFIFTSIPVPAGGRTGFDSRRQSEPENNVGVPFFISKHSLAYEVACRLTDEINYHFGSKVKTLV